MAVNFTESELIQLKNMLLVYEWVQKTMLTKLNILHEDLINFHDSNPIENICGRIKSPESIAAKLHKLNLDITADNAKKHIRDIVGIRIICLFGKDIYYLIDMIKAMPDVKVLKEKDYISNPKPSGYRSYHIIVEIPVYYSGKTENLPVEIQIRTEAMNFWASLEHKARYKYKEHIPQHLSDELVVCADKIAELDNRMFLIHDIISLINQDS